MLMFACQLFLAVLSPCVVFSADDSVSFVFPKFVFASSAPSFGADMGAFRMRIVVI